jgi:2-dehydropantoate 2-reductase
MREVSLARYDGVLHVESAAECVHEVAAVARAEGVSIDADLILDQIEGGPPALRSSMQKDREAGRPTEIDAIGGSVLRAAVRNGLDVPTTTALVDGIRAGEL